MTDDGIPDGATANADVTIRLSQLSSRTSLMVIDATLRALPKDVHGLAEAASEVRGLARRMTQAARDFDATVEFTGALVGPKLAG